VVGVFGARVASHFDGPPMDYTSHSYAGDAAGGLAQLDETYTAWIDGVRRLGSEGLLRPCGPAEGPWAQSPMAALVLHINREALHHGAAARSLPMAVTGKHSPAFRSVMCFGARVAVRERHAVPVLA
jgi:hypothetical protein